MASPAIIRWARETFGLEMSEAARRLSVSVNTLEKFEAGEKSPSQKQLIKMSSVYRRPLITFYLSEPPETASLGGDFRKTSNPNKTAEGRLQALIRQINIAHQMLKSGISEVDELTENPLVGSLNHKPEINEAVSFIKETLNTDSKEFYNQASTDKAFSLLREKCEENSVYVTLQGDLGSHHSKLNTDVFRGYALADNFLPLIVINSYDVRTAWSFTLIHELMHILIGETGVSSYSLESELEKYCDSIAGAFLLPESVLEEIIEISKNSSDLHYDISTFANQRNLGRGMVLYNLLRSKVITNTQYTDLQNAFDKERVRAAEKIRVTPGGPDYYVVRRSRVGSGMLGTVKRLVSEGALTTTKAGMVLGVKPTSVTKLLEAS